MPTIRVNIAESGHPTTTGSSHSQSYTGHMWISLPDGSTRGYAPSGVVYNDGQTYDSGYFSVEMEVTQQQYDSMMNFFDNADEYGFGKNDYNVLTNSCVDFTWAALFHAGKNPSGYEGDPDPKSNKNNIMEVAIGNPNSLTFFDNEILETAGKSLGASIGSLVAKDDVLKKLTISPLLETVGQNLFSTIGVGVKSAQGYGDLSDDVLDQFNGFVNDLGKNMSDAASGYVSSLLTAEFVRAIKAEGLSEELATTVSNAVLGQISRNIMALGLNELTQGATIGTLGNPSGIFSGLDSIKGLSGTVGNAVGGFIGAKLAEEALAGYDSEEEAIGAQVGGALTSAVTLYALTITGPVGWLIAGVAAFAGNFLGGTIGDLIHQARPEKASAQLKFDPETGEFIIARVASKRGGNVEGVKALANVASDAMESVLDVVDGDVINSDSFSGLFYWKESRNLHGPGYFEKGTTFDNAGGFHLWHNSVDDFNAVVEAGIVDMLSRLEVAGGDLHAKRALYNSLPQLFNDSNKPIEDPLQVLAGNLQVAEEYKTYLQNKDVINALIQTQPDSVFAVAWIATLARAAELGLNRRHVSDYYGGWRYLLDSAETTALNCQLAYRGNERLVGPDAQNDTRILRDLVDPLSKTEIQGIGVIDLRESAMELLGSLHKSGDLLITGQGVELPAEYSDLRQEGKEIWLGDTLIARLGSNGVNTWIRGVNIDLLIYVNSLAEDLAQGRKHLLDGHLYDIAAQISDDGALIPTIESPVLDGATLQGDEIIREGSVIASMNDEGEFTAIHDEDISVAAIVYGSAADDIIYSGDKGNDIFAGDGNDTVYGGANADWIYGGGGDDNLHAGDVDGNALFGEAGNDELHGGSGSDWLEGGQGDDRLYGDNGGDVLQGNAGNDYLEGGLGGDTYVFRLGDGDDTVADKGAASTTRIPSLPIVSIIESVLPLPNGSAHDQGNEDDILSFGPQITLDDLTYERSDDDLLVHIAGVDDDAQETLTLSDWFTDAGRIETLEFADGLRIPIAEIEQFINGTVENDQFTFADTEGSTLINALAGDDTIDMRDAAVDTQEPTNIPLTWILGSVLPVGSQPTAAASYVLNGGDGNDTIYGGGADDVLLGGSGDDQMEGGDGDDVLLGGAGNDDLKGGAGDDVLMGNAGDDQLDGGAGSDYLIGGVGNDQLTGGAGSDSYTFGYGDGKDSLNDVHLYEPEDAKLATLLESLDSLVEDMSDADGTGGLGTPPPVSGVLIIPAPGELETDRLLALMQDLKPIVESATGSHAENLAKALHSLSDELTQNKARLDQAALDHYAQKFRYLVLDAAGLLDIVDWSTGVEMGDIALGWEGDDLLLQLQSEQTDTNASPDSLRLQAWGSTAPYIERFDFTSGQVSIVDIDQWNGGSDTADQLVGGEGNDWITGGIGDDIISAVAGDDILNGNAGDDQLQGEEGDDLLNGGCGNDRLYGGRGVDILKGGSGDDLLFGGAGADQLDGGEGVDSVSYAEATAGVRVYLDNGVRRTIEQGLNGQVHELLQDAGSSEDRDTLIKQLLEALPDPDGLIGEVADRVPVVDKLKTSFSEAITGGQRDQAVALLQEIFDGTNELLQPDERSSLLETIEFVTQEPLPDATGMDGYWERVVSGLPERGILIERINDELPSRSEQGERLAELITTGDRSALVSVIGSWMESLYGDDAPAKAEAILALIPEELSAIRSPIDNLTAANEAIDTTDALFTFTSGGLYYGAQEEEETLGSFLGSDGAALTEAQSVTPFDDLAVKLNGYIYLDAGKHDFTVTADGGFSLKIGGVDFSEATSKAVSADFAAGFYHFELTYFEHDGEEELKVTSDSLADGNALDASFFYTDPLQVDPRLSEQTDDSGRTFLCFPATDEQGDYFDNIENVIGSAHDDLLWGDSGDNQLLGGDGADILYGAGGNDDLQGGAGDDRYEFGFGDGQDLVRDSAGDDILMLGEDIAPEQLWFSRAGDDLELSVIGTTDKLTVADWYSDANSRLETIATTDGQTLLDSQVESLVSAMSAFSPPDMGDATFGLAQEDKESLSSVIAASWQ